MADPCAHMHFDAKIKVARVEDVGKFVVEMQIFCKECSLPFQFVGLQPGFNYEAPTVTLDGLEASLPIVPQGNRPTPMQGLMGYTVGRTN